jgi:transposase-like protein
MRKQKKQISKYTEAFKWQVVQAVLSGKFNKEEARLAYGNRSNCAILDWMRKFSGSDDFGKTDTMQSNLAAMQNSKEDRNGLNN